jgi:hypothetical protein
MARLEISVRVDISGCKVCSEGGKLMIFYLIWNLHKSANAAGIRIRPIAAAIDYIFYIVNCSRMFGSTRISQKTRWILFEFSRVKRAVRNHTHNIICC